MSDILIHSTLNSEAALADLAPELLELARPIVAEWETAVLRVAAGGATQQKFAPDSPEAALQKRFRRLPAATRKRSAGRAAETLRSAKFQQRVGKFVELKNLTAQATVGSALKPVPKPTISKQRLAEILENRRVVLGLPHAGKPAPPKFKKLSLGLIRVVCIDETNGFLGSEAGEDEIELGGVALDGTTNIGKIAPFRVGDFDDGTRKELNNKKVFTFNVGNGAAYPRSFFVTFVMVEADNGDFSETMDDIIQKLSKESAEKLAALIGSSVGASGGPAGALIGLMVGWIVGKVVNAIVSAWEDDPFNPVTIEVIVPAFDAKLATPEGVVKFTGPGEYAMRYRWALA